MMSAVTSADASAAVVDTGQSAVSEWLAWDDLTTMGLLRPCSDPELPERLELLTERATEDVLGRVLNEIPLYRTLEAGQLADVRATVRAGYVATLRLWKAGSLAGPRQLEQFRANGATRAAEGRPLPLVLRAYRVSGIAIYDWVVEQCDAELDRTEERNFARLTMAFVDQLTNEVSLGYVEATGQLANQQGRARREFLEDLLAGRVLGSATVAERAATLGLSVPRRPCLILASPRFGEGSRLADQARTALQELSQLREPDLPSTRLQLITRGQLVVIDETIDVAVLRRALERADLAGVVINVDDLAEVADAYRQARQVHELMRTAIVPDGLVVGHQQAPLLALMSRIRRDTLADPAAAAILGEVRAPQHAALLETLDAYFACSGNAVSAAHRLGVHAQTMRYRIKRIHEITGLDLSQGWDRFLLEFALRISDRTHRLNEHPT